MRWIPVVALGILLPRMALASTTVFVSPCQVVVEEGEAFDLSIRVDAGTDTVTCFLVEFVFDGTVLQLASAEEGSLFADCGYETMFDWDVNGPGWHSCNDVTLGHWAYAICPGEIVKLEFQAVSWGGTSVEVVAADLRDINRDPILPVQTSVGLVTVTPATGVEDGLPDGARRLGAAPNPFRTDVTLSLEGCLRLDGEELVVYDVAGRLVARWPLSECSTGRAAITWDGTGSDGAVRPSGVYFALARGPGWERRASLVLVR